MGCMILRRCPSRTRAPCARLTRALSRLTQGLAKRQAGFNVVLIGSAELGEAVLPALFPSTWKGCQRVAWPGPGTMGVGASGAEGPSEEIIELLWQRIRLEDDLAAVSRWPLLPVLPKGLRTLAGASSVIAEGSWTEAAASALVKCGIDLVSATPVLVGRLSCSSARRQGHCFSSGFASAAWFHGAPVS